MFQDSDRTGTIRYTEFLAATIESLVGGIINKERIADAFDRFDDEVSGYITIDSISEVLGNEDFPLNEVRNILGDAAAVVDLSNGDGDGATMASNQISYSAFLKLFEKNHRDELSYISR